MKKWVWHLGLAAASVFSALFAACTTSDGVGDTAGSSFETENSVALTVQLANGGPAARTAVLVRPEDFLAGASSRSVVGVNQIVETDTAAGIFNEMTDDQGLLNLPKMKTGDYVVEARDESEKAFTRISVKDGVVSIKDSVCDTLSISMAKVGSMTGQVVLPEGVRSVSVGIRGLDYVVETDSLGNFEFPSLPEGSFNAVGFVFSTYTYVNENGDLSSYDSFQALGVETVVVESKKTREDVLIGRLPGPIVVDTTAKDTVAGDTAAVDTAAVDPIPEDTVDVYPVVLLDNFENGTYAWYTSVSRHASAKLRSAVISGKGTDHAARLECSKDSIYYEWTMMGRRFADYTDFSDLDSVVLWARAEFIDSDSMWISVSFDVQADSASGYESGKAWAHVGLVDANNEPTEEWLRIVVTPKDMVPADSTKNGGNIGWDNVKDHINSFGIFAGGSGIGSYAVWIDDVEIYGVKDLVQ